MLKKLWLRGLMALLLAMAPVAAEAAGITVFAAASLTDALGDVGKAYQAKTGNNAALSFAASSALARQIEASGGADIFMSADTDWMEYLDSRGLIQHDTRKNLLGNHLVLIAPAGANVALTIAPHFDLLGALGGGRLSIADPDSVPAGKYARTALTTLGVWNAVVNHLVQAENVRVALTYVSRGEAPLGIVYTTDALSDKGVHVVGTFPESSHAPIVYPAALVKDAKPEAKAFLDFLSGPEAKAIFEKDGFVILGSR
ncbi:MAG TPA: molybdate ABC transporter substrate-binding protein [Rhizomicrobium sp.]|jgi:molybdate transport system substrate-binding protein|nr:molybdate ABC transporter substrate-binding protein [Rhizomicrobium sp.]